MGRLGDSPAGDRLSYPGEHLPTEPRILLIDEDEQDRSLAAVVLARDLDRPKLVEVPDATAFARALAGAAFDAVIVDFELSWSSGREVLETVQRAKPGTPVLAFTRADDVEEAVRAMRDGAADYILKSSKGFLRLAPSLRRALEAAERDQQIARSEPWLQTLLDRANVGVFRSSLDGRLVEANPAVLRLLGVQSVSEALKLDLPTHFHANSEGKADLLQRLSSEGELQARVVEIERPDGTQAWLNLTEILLLDVDGDIVVDILMQDISHLRSADADLDERMRELERSNQDLLTFASVASHELKEPLRAVGKYSEFLEQDLQETLDKRSRESLTYIREAVERMQGLVADLLEFSRLSTGWQGFEACDCNTLVDGAIRNLSALIEENGATVRREGLPTVLADAGELEQVFQNLISNALKFRSDEPPVVAISARRDEDHWLFSVQDNGIGMDPRDSDKIFKIFGRLHPERPGSGIGLALCQRIVERHGGRIWVESTPGRGANFSFTIAVSEDETRTPVEVRPGAAET